MNDERNWGENRDDSEQQLPRYEHYQFQEKSRTVYRHQAPPIIETIKNLLRRRQEQPLYWL